MASSVILQAWRMDAATIAHPGDHGRLVVGDPVLHAVAQGAGDHVGIFDESLRRGANRPAAFVFQCLGKIPVIQRHKGNNVCIQKTIHQPAVEVHSLLIDLAASQRQNPRPGDRKAVGLQSQLFHQTNVFFPQTVVVICHIAGIVVADLSGGVREAVPGRFAFAVLVPGTFDLVGSGGRSPDEVLRKDNFVCHQFSMID